MNKKNVILGTVQFGQDYGINNSNGKPLEKDVFKVLEYATKNGVKILDTADAYGNAIELLGSFNQLNPGRFLINTKFRKTGISLREQLDKDLKALYIRHVNTYFFHSFNDFTKYPGLLKELSLLKSEKVITNIGMSVYENEELSSAINMQEIDVIQLPFNLLDNYVQRGKLLQKAKANGKKIQVRSVFLQGLFFKQINEIGPKLNALIPYLQRIKKIALINNLTIEQLALQYTYQQKEIDHVLIGVDNLEQLKRNLYPRNKELSDDVIGEINNINVKETSLLYPKNWS